MSSTLVIGPPSSGKTALAGVLQHAAHVAGPINGFADVRMRPRSPALVELARDASRILHAGRLPFGATQQITEYALSLHVTRRETRWLFFEELVEREYAFEMLDGPGGGVFGAVDDARADLASQNEWRARLVGALGKASGLLICLSAIHPEAALTVFRDLPAFFQATGLSRLPLERVAVVLTKIDAWAVKRGLGRGARARVERTDAYQLAHELVPAAAFASLRNHLRPDTQVGFGLASAFGFLESEGGQPNCRASLDAPLIDVNGRPDAVHVINAWQPYACLDPFLFLATGHTGSLRIVRAGDLR